MSEGNEIYKERTGEERGGLLGRKAVAQLHRAAREAALRGPREEVIPHCVPWVPSSVPKDLVGYWDILIAKGQSKDPSPLSHLEF